MRRGRTLIVVLLLVVIVLAGGFFAFTQLTKKPASTPETAKPVTVEVYMASQPIPQGVVITEEVLGKMSSSPSKRNWRYV